MFGVFLYFSNDACQNMVTQKIWDMDSSLSLITSLKAYFYSHSLTLLKIIAKNSKLSSSSNKLVTKDFGWGDHKWINLVFIFFFFCTYINIFYLIYCCTDILIFFKSLYLCYRIGTHIFAHIFVICWRQVWGFWSGAADYWVLKMKFHFFSYKNYFSCLFPPSIFSCLPLVLSFACCWCPDAVNAKVAANFIIFCVIFMDNFCWYFLAIGMNLLKYFS